MLKSRLVKPQARLKLEKPFRECAMGNARMCGVWIANLMRLRKSLEQFA